MSNPIYDAIFDVARVLEIPVVVVALLSLAVVIVELGALLTELNTRRRRGSPGGDNGRLTSAALDARRAIEKGSVDDAAQALRPVAYSAPMESTVAAFLAHLDGPGRDNRIAKDLADFDFGRQRRLGRTRLLVRLGPALGLMGTLIPLSPALDGLAKGNVQSLTDNLRVAFSVTVLGLFVGAIAFGLSLLRERIYGQDYSDLEYIAAVLTDDDPRYDTGSDSKPDETPDGHGAETQPTASSSTTSLPHEDQA